MTHFEQISMAKNIWTLVLDSVPMPDDRTIYRWLVTFGIEEYERALPRVLWRYRNQSPDSEQIYRFISSTLSMAKKKKDGSSKQCFNRKLEAV